MRLFVGIALPPDVSDALEGIRQQFEPRSGTDLRWSAPEGWHVTLQFLGQVSDERATCVYEQLKTIRASQVPICIDGLGFFDRAGVFWAGVTLTPELLALQQFVTAAMRHCEFTPEDRPYSPHITLARAKGRGSKALQPLQKALEKNKTPLHAEFTAEEFLLYESFPGPKGSRYEIRARFPLKPNSKR
ncbi:MAG TPA: RNA 2',3'-cyclic phosphodiesterase [Acidobacteriaceae bacterium]|nr:RNA 2',3'-cyclic phosphodiesterase [Acidobacteriaceae bacterium]